MSGNLREHPLVVRYLEQVCGMVKAKEVHEDIKLEMLSHLEELVEDRAGVGSVSEEEAIADAIRQMGDPELIGKQLHAAHKPKTDWMMLIMLALLIGIGLIAVIAVQWVGSDRLGAHYMVKKIVYVGIGLAAMTGLYFMDYRKLQRYSWHLYGATIVLMVAAKLTGPTINGSAEWLKVGSLIFNVFAVSPYLFMIAYAGICNKAQGMNERGTVRKAQMLLKEIAAFIVLPAYLYLSSSSLLYFSIYYVGLLAILLASKKYKLAASGLALKAAGIMAVIFGGFSNYQHVWYRLAGFVTRNSDSIYQTQRSVEAIQGGGMWGQGLGAVYDRLPFYNSEMLYSYLVYTLGWVFGCITIVLCLAFVVRLTGMALKLRDTYARTMVVGIVVVFGIQFAWNLLMSFGLMPISSTTLPFVSWSSYTIVELAVVGLLLSAYRRKDMIGRHADPLTAQKA